MRVIHGQHTVRAVWSPINQAYLVLWGSADITRAQVLAVKRTKHEARDYMREIGALESNQ